MSASTHVAHPAGGAQAIGSSALFALAPLVFVCGARVAWAVASGESWGAEPTLCSLLLSLGVREIAGSWRLREDRER